RLQPVHAGNLLFVHHRPHVRLPVPALEPDRLRRHQVRKVRLDAAPAGALLPREVLLAKTGRRSEHAFVRPLVVAVQAPDQLKLAHSLGPLCLAGDRVRFGYLRPAPSSILSRRRLSSKPPTWASST